MSKLGLSFLLLASSFHYMAVYAIAPDPADTNFIKASCKITLYPDLCVQTLSSYAGEIKQSKKQLAQAALTVSLSRARPASEFVSKMAEVSGINPQEFQAVKDCVNYMADSVDQLGRSSQELGQMGGAVSSQEFEWHASNLQTWVSAALTDANTCVGGFADPGMDGNVKSDIVSRVNGVAEVTSNALALVSHFVAP
ncbi:hypothetical protein U1Q18_021355 [Sarracenia purpurea var. burkii]